MISENLGYCVGDELDVSDYDNLYLPPDLLSGRRERRLGRLKRRLARLMRLQRRRYSDRRQTRIEALKKEIKGIEFESPTEVEKVDQNTRKPLSVGTVIMQEKRRLSPEQRARARQVGELFPMSREELQTIKTMETPRLQHFQETGELPPLEAPISPISTGFISPSTISPTITEQEYIEPYRENQYYEMEPLTVSPLEEPATITVKDNKFLVPALIGGGALILFLISKKNK